MKCCLFSQAGIKSHQLGISLEPECASLYSQFLPVDRFSGDGQAYCRLMAPGTVYMIVDLGGKLETESTSVHRNSLASAELSVCELYSEKGIGLLIFVGCALRFFLLVFRIPK